MEFKIANKAKTLTLALLIIGVVFTAIGVILNWDSEFLGRRIMASSLVSSFFFFAIGLGALFFLALQYATETGWYASVKRMIEAIAGFLPYGIGLLVLVFIALTVTKGGHIYSWMDPEVVKHDKLIQGKTAFLNIPFWWVRTIIYLA